MKFSSFVTKQLVTAMSACAFWGAGAATDRPPFEGFEHLQDFGRPSATASLEFGTRVALNKADGTRLAVGDPSFGANQGVIIVYTYAGPERGWRRVQTIVGNRDEKIGGYFALSNQGRFIAVRRHRDQKSAVEMYDIFSLEQIGETLFCTSGEDGRTVTLSDDSKLLAVSCEGFSNGRGSVDLYRQNEANSWVPEASLEGIQSGEHFGWDTALTSAGDRLVISAPDYTHNGVARRGKIQVYDFDGENWDKFGQDLLGGGALRGFGYSVAVSGDGRIVLGASPGLLARGVPDGGYSEVQAFVRFRNVWMPVGGVIESETGRFDGVAIDQDASRIAISSVLDGTYKLRVMNIRSGLWVQHGDVLSGPKLIGHGRFNFGFGNDGNRVVYATADSEGEPLIGTYDHIALSDEPEETVPDYGGEWSIAMKDLVVEFNSANAHQEIKATYEFNLQDFQVQVLDMDCNSTVPSNIIAFTTTVQREADDDKELLTVALDVNQELVRGSPIYSVVDDDNAMLAFCIRVDLNDNTGTSVGFEQNRVFVGINQVQDFSLMDVGVETGSRDFRVDTSLEYMVDACQCDENFECVDIPLGPNDPAYVCLELDSTEVDIASIRQLRFEKGSVAQTAVYNGVGDPFTVVHLDGSKATIQSKLISAFFEDGEEVSLTGVCVLSFHDTSGRKRSLRGANLRQRMMTGSSSVLNSMAGFGAGLQIADGTVTSGASFTIGFLVMMGVALVSTLVLLL